MLILLLGVVFIVYYLWSQRKNFTAWWKIGGPFGYPFIGVGLQFADQKSKLMIDSDFKLKNKQYLLNKYVENYI